MENLKGPSHQIGPSSRVDRVFLRIYDAGLLPFLKITLELLLALQVLNQPILNTFLFTFLLGGV
jgi:hypothetical protein